ncbi:outer envelope pore protein 21, chloroplastic-like [Ananas comosus]|uniref:Outer envelope pore protein 21, chloroplastic-like n=1 Tax=Ananas comosus TaxID=4615 RepID=A0A6P5GZ21_ANACO|nr:outer envelope pore protein 21, chloroplastic-like [Ananas comosus]
METSLRLGGDSKTLRIHAKEKLRLGPQTLLQAHGEIDTCAGAPSYLALLIRQFYPQLSANVDVGVQLDKGGDINYSLRGKKALSITSNGLVGINIKGRLVTDKEFMPGKKSSAVELSWSILNFQKDQDVRIKVGYELFDKVPYLQIRENNWTLNTHMNGKWNVRFDL